MNNCIFCKIARGEIPAEIVFEDKEIVAFKDTHPLAPVHILIIPRQHIATIDDLTERDTVLAGKLIMASQRIARELGTAEGGYKLLFRVKNYGGQEVNHIHLHLLGGAKLYEEIRPA